MRILLIFLLITCIVCSEEEGNGKKLPTAYFHIADEICYSYGNEILTENCTNCGMQAITEFEGKRPKDKEEYKKFVVARTKDIAIKCIAYLTDTEKWEECTKMDELEFKSCWKAILPSTQMIGRSSRFCFHSNETEQCEQCVIDNLKKGWEITYNNAVKIEAEKKKELEENEATEIANNCNHLFENKDEIKECANKELGQRMDCAEDTMIRDSSKPYYVPHICFDSAKDSKREECQNCIAEIMGETADVDREKCKKALEKCGEYMDGLEEMMECTKKETEEMLSCLNDVSRIMRDRKEAVWICKNNSKSDECKECVFQSFQKTREAVEKMPEEDKEFHFETNELMVIEISTNCYQHFEKAEEIKDCGNKEYGGKVECIKEVLHLGNR